MDETSKYHIHADVTADGVVERSDVVGAIFGQTEGLLGEELDLRDLRQSQKVGRIDVEIASASGQSHGELTIATSLDKVETATLAAALETIERVGPCRATLEVTGIEDVRAAKRREVVDRATELLRTGFDDTVMSSEEILAEVRQHVRVEDITEFEGAPAGPRVADSDAIIVVEGRADVLTLLKYGIKNAIAVEGTNVPDAVAELTGHRTVTAFLDGDRGGDLILEELAQVGELDYVAFAPSGSSVEDLDHHQLFAALRNKVPYESISEHQEPRSAVAATDGSASPAPAPPADESPSTADESPSTTGRTDGSTSPAPSPKNERDAGPSETTTTRAQTALNDDADTADDGTDGADGDANTAGGDADEPRTVYEHATTVIRAGTDTARFVDAEGKTETDVPAGDAYEALTAADTAPQLLVLDAILGQRLLDLAADRGVERIVARSLGQFTKRPTGVQIHAINDVAEATPE
ncbi:DNA primase DnaG [Halobacteria archaeon AArc-dxtr1]|nr:DNA primase DnaG [Halobacteria archaeon AArc-dxtr1]